jgi:hypothetical protein
MQSGKTEKQEYTEESGAGVLPRTTNDKQQQQRRRRCQKRRKKRQVGEGEEGPAGAAEIRGSKS